MNLILVMGVAVVSSLVSAGAVCNLDIPRRAKIVVIGASILGVTACLVAISLQLHSGVTWNDIFKPVHTIN